MSQLKVTKSKPKEVKQIFMALIVSCLQALLLDNTWFKAWNIGNHDTSSHHCELGQMARLLPIHTDFVQHQNVKIIDCFLS